MQLSPHKDPRPPFDEISSVWHSPLLLYVRTEQKELKLVCLLTLIQTRKVRKNADFKYVHFYVFSAKDWQVNDDNWKIKCLLTKIIVPFRSAFAFTFCVFGSCFRRPAINFVSDFVVVVAVVVVVVNTYLTRHDPSVKMVQSKEKRGQCRKTHMLLSLVSAQPRPTQN